MLVGLDVPGSAGSDEDCEVSLDVDGAVVFEFVSVAGVFVVVEFDSCVGAAVSGVGSDVPAELSPAGASVAGVCSAGVVSVPVDGAVSVVGASVVGWLSAAGWLSAGTVVSDGAVCVFGSGVDALSVVGVAVGSVEPSLPLPVLESLPDELELLVSAAFASSFVPKINIVPNSIEAVPTVNLRIEYLLRLLGRKSNFFIEKIPPHD